MVQFNLVVTSLVCTDSRLWYQRRLKMAGKDTVLIAIDGSDNSEKAFHWYIEHLHKPGNQLVIAHAAEMPGIPTKDNWEHQMKEINAKKEALEQKYKVQMQELNIDGKFFTNMEKPGNMICETAKSEKCDYIVMSSRGLGKLRRTILGSVSDYVVHHSHCPVIVDKICQQ